MSSPPPVPLTLDLAELVLIHALRNFDPTATRRTRYWQLSLHALLTTLGPRTTFPGITTTAVYRCLTLCDYYHDLVFTKNDASLLALTLRIWRRKPTWRIPPRSLYHCTPTALVPAVRAARAEVVGEWLALAVEQRLPVRKRTVGSAVRACVRFEQWEVLSEVMRCAPRLERLRAKVSSAWMWSCALRAALTHNSRNMDAAISVMDKVRGVHQALYTADRERMAAEIQAIGDDEAKRKAYAYIGQPSWRTLVDSLRFMQGVLASALRCREPERVLVWWFRFDEELKAWDVERVREVVLVGMFKQEGVDAVVRWWYRTHAVRKKPRWTPQERWEYWYASWW